MKTEMCELLRKINSTFSLNYDTVQLRMHKFNSIHKHVLLIVAVAVI